MFAFLPPTRVLRIAQTFQKRELADICRVRAAGSTGPRWQLALTPITLNIGHLHGSRYPPGGFSGLLLLIVIYFHVKYVQGAVNAQLSTQPVTGPMNSIEGAAVSLPLPVKHRRPTYDGNMHKSIE